jgi:8-amino-7-oxononanoate synthase
MIAKRLEVEDSVRGLGDLSAATQTIAPESRRISESSHNTASGTMLSNDELRWRMGQVFSGPLHSAPPAPAPADYNEPRFYSRLRAVPAVEAVRAAEALRVSPFFIPNESLDGPVACIDGRETLMFGSNNYLGLTRHPEVVQAARDALDKYGTSCTGSRLLNGTIAPHAEFEEEIAGFLGYPKAILFTTGFMANQGAISSLCRRGDQVFSDRDNHASIVDGLTGSGVQYYLFGHNDTAELNSKMSKLEAGPPRLVIADSVYSMSGDIVKLPELMSVARRHGALVYLDEAHGIGTLGATGRGAAEHFGLADKPDLVMGTLSKSLASIGGFVAGPEVVIDYLRLFSRSFVFSAAGAPAMAAAGLAALRVLRREPERVEATRANARYLAEGLRQLGFTCGSGSVPIIAVRAADAVQGCTMHRALLQAGVLTNMVLFPAVPPGEAMLRVSVMATHTREYLDRGLSVFETIGRQLGVIGPRADLRRLLQERVNPAVSSA